MVFSIAGQQIFSLVIMPKVMVHRVDLVIFKGIRNAFESTAVFVLFLQSYFDIKANR